MDTEVRIEHQLQFWDAKAKVYVSQGAFAHDAEHARILAGGRGWRICRADRPVKNPKLVASRSTAGRPVDDVQRDYLRWARRDWQNAMKRERNRATA